MKNNVKLFYLLSILNTVFLSIFLLSASTCTAAAKSKNAISFVKKYQSAACNQQLKYKIKNLSKTDFAIFSVSNSSLAFINKSSGLLTPKKSGTVTVTANIYNKKNILLKTLHDTLIIKKNNCIPNASFQIKHNINSWNFHFTISCNRILLKNEISSDTLTLLPKGKKFPKLTASFSKLSSNGKNITYILSPSSQKKLCPGDSSMNGTYLLKSSCFSQTLTITYRERLTKNTISGFVLKENGNPVKDALLSLKKKGTVRQSCHSDSNGHYSFQNVLSSDSLTVSKNGFQTKTIERPVFSSKGTTCENIILRSTAQFGAAVKFLVTDTNNTPIPNASVYLISGASKNVIEKINDKAAAGFVKNNSILYSGKTDDDGTLLLTSFIKEKETACSYINISNNTTLSYSAKERLLSTNTAKISSAILNTTDYYTVIVQSFYPDNITAAYQTQLFTFSFSELLTEQAKIHIQLTKGTNVFFDNITVHLPDSLPDCHSVSITFYHPEQEKSFYQTDLSREAFTKYHNKIILSATLPLTLPDGTYYISIKALSNTNKILAASPILPVTITHSEMFSDEIQLEESRFARLLAYHNDTANSLKSFSFHLYQKCDTFSFYLKNISGKAFQQNNNAVYTASFLLSGLHTDCSYLLQPAANTFYIKPSSSFSVTANNSYSSENAAWYSLAPIAKAECISVSEKENTFIGASKNNSVFINSPTCHSVSQSLIRSSTTYPNCVIAHYKTNGILLSLSLTLPPVNQNAAFSFRHSNTITDIYINKKILITTQDFFIEVFYIFVLSNS